MSTWAAKRFWKDAKSRACDGGFTVELDGRAVRTPAKMPLIVPTRALAEALVAEWLAQEDQIDPNTMPMTRLANSALDKVTDQFGAVADMIAAYGDSDLLCYRSDGPDELVERQAKAWDPLLDWAAEALDARLSTRTGIMHQPQEQVVLKRLSDHVHALSNFQLTAFHDLVTLSGSLVLGFAIAKHVLSAEEAWDLSRLDENWQEEKWGVDRDAAQMALRKRESLLNAVGFFHASTNET